METTDSTDRARIRQRLEELRGLMGQRGIHAYLVPSTDPHQSEYAPRFWRRREWISGFTGSAGDVVVTGRRAVLWTDSRYHLQAEQQLADTGIELFRSGEPGVPDPCDWLAGVLEPGQTVGFDPALMAHSQAEAWRRRLDIRRVRLGPVGANLIDLLWKDRPHLPGEPAVPHETRFSGETSADKIARVRGEMSAEGVDALVVTPLDSVAWLFNIRGSDVPFNPVSVAYGLVTHERAALFVAESATTAALREHVGDLADIRSYRSFSDAVSSLAETAETVWLDPDATSEDVASRLEGRCRILYRRSPVSRFKAVKNATEIRGFEAAHVRDGAAMVRFLGWLERAVPDGGVTELSAADKLESLRREGELYRGPSFATISAFGGHAAIVHYSATPETDRELRADGLYLVDSGGQYLDGTTDITRTVVLGGPTEEERERFTLVLKGHIALAAVRFPEGAQGVQLDALARRPLWDRRLDYGHGTGHGIGSYLNVHEGPQALSPTRGIGEPLRPGMFLSIEPGYYQPNAYGIRIENLVYVKEDDGQDGGQANAAGARTRSRTRTFCRFETVTLCPIDRKLVEPGLLTPEEIGYIDRYHERVRQTLSPLVTGEDRKYLQRVTRPL